MRVFLCMLCCLFILLSCRFNSEPDYSLDSIEGSKADSLYSAIVQSKRISFTKDPMGKIKFNFIAPSHYFDIPADITISHVKIIINGNDYTASLNQNYPYGSLPMDYIPGANLLVNFEIKGRYYGKYFEHRYNNIIKLAYPIDNFETNYPQTIEESCRATWNMENNNSFQYIYSSSGTFLCGGDGTIQSIRQNIPTSDRECDFPLLTTIPTDFQDYYFNYGIVSFNATKYQDFYVVSAVGNNYSKTIR